MDKIVLLVASFVAEVLVKNDIVPAPHNSAEADFLLKVCAEKFVQYASAALPVIEGCNGDCDHGTETVAASPNRRGNGSLN